MMNFRFNILLFLLLIALVSSCRKDRISILLEELSTPTNAILYDITFTDIDTGYVVGGFHWQHQQVGRVGSAARDLISVVESPGVQSATLHCRFAGEVLSVD